MADPGEVFVFVSRTSIDVDANTRKMARQSFCSNSDAIGKGSDLIELRRILNANVSRSTEQEDR